jgi:hypothetical protein
MSAILIWMPPNNNSGMPAGRGILTEYERECLAGEHAKQREYESRSRVRSRIEGPLTEDIKHLEEHDPGLLNELREVVCEGG